MKDDSKQKRAEEFLADDLPEELTDSAAGDVGDELRLALQIKKSIADRKAVFQADEKADLEKRILASIGHEQKRKPVRTLVWLSSAAVLVLAVLLSVYVNFMRNSGLREVAGQMNALTFSGNTRLIIPQQEEVEIQSTDSKIDYSSGTNRVQINEAGATQEKMLASASNYNTLVVPYGKRSQLTLPDGTQVWLNSGSSLTYPVQFKARRREVFLQGEALFEVSHNAESPFSVLTSKMDVRVLGTVFNLSAYDSDSVVSTVLVKGSVELRYRGFVPGIAATEKMVPGKLAEYNIREKRLVQRPVATEQFTSWKDGYLIFENSSLGAIAQKLERYYNVRILFENELIKNEKFSGNLDLGKSAIEVMRIITQITDTDVIDDGAVIRVTNRKQS